TQCRPPPGKLTKNERGASWAQAPTTVAEIASRTSTTRIQRSLVIPSSPSRFRGQRAVPGGGNGRPAFPGRWVGRGPPGGRSVGLVADPLGAGHGVDPLAGQFGDGRRRELRD